MATRTVVFDMDGTLVQTRAASWDVFQDTARRFELPIRSAEEFFELFRGNFYESLKTLCGDADVEEAVREHFLQGLRDRYAPRFIPGMSDVVKALAVHYPLAVMSSNAMSAIRRILEDEGVADCFAHVFSGEVGSSKEAHLRQILDEPSYGNARNCSPSYVEGDVRDADDVVLITDTVGDVREARMCGVRAIGVAWGMHSSDALLEAGAETVALWPQELLAILLPAGGCGTPGGQACQCALSGSCRPRSVIPDPPSHGQTQPWVATVTTGQTSTPERGWPWPAVIAAGQQRRQRRATVRHADTRPRVKADAQAGPPRRTTAHNTDPALTAALHRISQLAP
jgi:phosphoglycolate phosphatase